MERFCNTVEHQIIAISHFRVYFSRRMNLKNINVAIMNREGSPFPSGTKNQAIASVVGEKNASNVQDYNEILVFLVNRDVQDVSYLW